MGDEAVLELPWREPFAAHLQHVIRSAAIDIRAVRTPSQHVTGDIPFSAKCAHRLVHLLPVADRPRLSTYPQRTDLTVGHLLTFSIAKLHLEPRNGAPERAGC